MRALAAAALLSMVPVARAEPSISLNGIPIDGVVNQRFENATVVIDENGNVHILARGYAVERAPPPQLPVATAPPPRLPAAAPAGPPAPDKVTRRYFLVAERSAPGATEYDVAVFLNGRWVHEIRSEGEADPFEVTRFLQPGPNKVTLVASKRAGPSRRAGSRDGTLRVLIGEGSAGGGHVLVEEPLVQMVRRAAETDTFTEEHTLVAR